MATGITDLAKELGVSVATVSRAINNKEGVSEEMKKKVIQTAKKMKYRVNSSARNLKTQKDNVIAILVNINHMVSELTHYIMTEKLDGIVSVLREEGYDLCIYYEDFNKKNSVLDLITKKAVDGVLALDVFSDEIIETLKNYKIPYVAVNWLTHTTQKQTYVRSDPYETMEMIMDYVEDKGYKNVGIINWLDNMEGTTCVKDAVRYAFEKRNLSIENVIWDTDVLRTKEQIYEYIKSSKKDLYISMYFKYGFWILDYARENNLNIPKDFALINYDYCEAFKYMHPKMTWIKQDTLSIAKLATKKLIGILNGQDEKSELIVPILIPGETC